MSIKRKLLFAYVLLVIVPLLTMIFVVNVVNTPDMDRLEGGFHQLDKIMKESVVTPVIMDLQTAQSEVPSRIVDTAYLNTFFEGHKRLIHMTVRKSEEVIYKADKLSRLQNVSREELIDHTLQFRVGEELVKVDVSLLPLNLLITGQEVENIVNARIKWGLLSYLTVHLLFIGYTLKYFLKPFNELKNVANKVGRKEYDFVVDTSRNDEIGETFRAFEGMRQSIQTYETNRKELVANISHDLKTPITAIKGYITAIQDGVANSPEKLDKYLEIMGRNVTHLDQLVDDLLLHSKLDVDQVSFDLRSVALDKYMDYLVDDIRLELEPKDIKVVWHAPSSGPIVCNIDAFKMRRVILNLVDNAVKHFNKAERRLTLSLAVVDQFAVISVEDNGKGISEAELSLVFERFYRTDSSRNTSIGGSGLGLAISKQIMEKHKGFIEVSSELGVYTKFDIKLPIEGLK